MTSARKLNALSQPLFFPLFRCNPVLQTFQRGRAGVQVNESAFKHSSASLADYHPSQDFFGSIPGPCFPAFSFFPSSMQEFFFRALPEHFPPRPVGALDYMVFPNKDRISPPFLLSSEWLLISLLPSLPSLLLFIRAAPPPFCRITAGFPSFLLSRFKSPPKHFAPSFFFLARVKKQTGTPSSFLQ